MIEQIKKISFALTLLGNVVFFSVNSILGRDYAGIANSNTYMYFCVSLFVIVLVYSIRDFVKIKNKHYILIPFILILIFCFEYSLFAYNEFQEELMRQSLRGFLAFSVPCILIGVNMANTENIDDIYPWIDVIAMITSIGCVVSLPRLMISGEIEYGGGSYQQLSYSAALSFSVLLCNALSNNRYRLSLLNNKIVSIVSYFLMFACVVCVLSSGGRGGFVLLVVNTILLLFNKAKELLSLFKILIFFLIVVLLILFIIDFNIINDLINSGLERITGTFSIDGGSAISKGGREEVYNLALKYIRENPFGYGLFRSYAVMGNYPHNLILEILMDGGFLLLLLFSFIMVILIRKIVKIKKSGADITFLSIIGAYPIIMLQFTSTFMWSGLFWFFLVYLLSYNIKNSRI